MSKKLMLLIICTFFICITPLIFTKDIFHFDLRDYSMSWYMKREDVIKLNRKEIKENGTKIILSDDAGNKMDGNIEYDENGELYKIWFYLDEFVKPKNSEEYRKIKESYLSKYREIINEMEVIYGKKRNSHEISDDDHIYEENLSPLISGFEYYTYWIHQYHTLIDVTYDGNDKTGFELVLQFISLRHYIDSIDKSHQK